MAITNFKQQNNSNSNFKQANAWMRVRLVRRDKETGEVTGEKWVCKDIPLYDSNVAARSMIQNSEKNANYVYELNATVYVPGEESEDELLDFE